MVDRSNRESATREKQERRKAWTPPSQLDAPPAPMGISIGGLENVLWIMTIKQISINDRREGYELVRAEDYPDTDYTNVIDEGKNAGVIGQGGLLLARIPEEIVDRKKSILQG